MFENYRVYLRALEQEDYEKSYEWRQDEEIWKTVLSPRYYVSKYYEKKWTEERINNQQNNLTLVVCDRENGESIGFVHLTNIDYRNRKASFGKLIGEKQYWGKGYATEATMLMLYHGFYELGLERIEARQLIDNVASIKVNKKCGFQNEGVMRHGVLKSGEYRDLNVMSVLKDDYIRILNDGKKEGILS
jgi:RimJ/RimL family protein N-acetyltransferase